MSLDYELAFAEKLLTLANACRALPTKPAPTTLWRWRTKGVKVNGRVVKLECVRVGGKWFTTASAFSKFLQQQNENDHHRAAPTNEVNVRTGELQSRLMSAGLLE